MLCLFLLDVAHHPGVVVLEFKRPDVPDLFAGIVAYVDFIPCRLRLPAEEDVLSDVAALVGAPGSLEPRLCQLLKDVALD